MSNNFMNLKDANKLFREKKYFQAQKIYEKLYKEERCLLAKQNLEILKYKVNKENSCIDIKNYEKNYGSLCSSKEHWFEHLSNDQNFYWFVAMTKKTRSVGARDMLALLATNKYFDYKQLEDLLESYRILAFKEKAFNILKEKINIKYWLELARTVFAQNENPYDNINAKTLYDICIKKYSEKVLSGVDISYISIIQSSLGHYGSARKTILDWEERDAQRKLNHQYLFLNTLNPKEEKNVAKWLFELNNILENNKLLGVHVNTENKKLFYRLKSHKIERDLERVKLSVLMPMYNPNESTLLAIDSILNQTWNNIELIIVDDATPSCEYSDYIINRIKEIVDDDYRVKLIFNSENRGAYYARNTAYDLATGDYVTVADKDDWHHPNKYEIQINDLERNKEKIANIVSWARVNEDMEFVVRWGPDRIAHPSFASMMFRREKVKKDIGYWDTVRKSADGEFKMRLQKFYGIRLEPLLDVPLAFSLMADDNLTSEDLGMGYESNDRAFYRKSFESWHIGVKNLESLYVDFQLKTRKFPAPASFLPIKEKNIEIYDVVFLSEFGFEAGNNTILMNEIKGCLKIGLRVGAILLQNFYIESAAKRHFTEDIFQLISDGEVDRLTLEDDVTTKLLLIRWPTILQYIGSKRAILNSERILVVANHAPYDEINNRRSYDIHKVSSNVKFLFDKYPIWVPESEQMLPIIKPLLPQKLLREKAWKGMLISSSIKDKVVCFDKKPTIGRHARDSYMKWPHNRSDFTSIYPVNGVFNVAILGGVYAPIKDSIITKEEINNWEVYKFNEINVSAYLKKLDFFVYFHHPHMTEAFGMSIIEAIQHGVVCLLPHNFRKVFKNGAIYCTPNEVEATIKDFWGDSKKYKMQQESGWDFFDKNCSLEVFKERITEVLEDR